MFELFELFEGFEGFELPPFFIPKGIRSVRRVGLRSHSFLNLLPRKSDFLDDVMVL